MLEDLACTICKKNIYSKEKSHPLYQNPLFPISFTRNSDPKKHERNIHNNSTKVIKSKLTLVEKGTRKPKLSLKNILKGQIKIRLKQH